MLVENVVAQIIRAAGHKLYFYSNSDRTDATNRMEIDFLIAKSRTQVKGNISPIEVKSGRPAPLRQGMCDTTLRIHSLKITRLNSFPRP